MNRFLRRVRNMFFKPKQDRPEKQKLRELNDEIAHETHALEELTQHYLKKPDPFQSFVDDIYNTKQMRG